VSGPVIRRRRSWLRSLHSLLVMPASFTPHCIYLTEYKCNMECHYCWAFNNIVKGMTEDTARRSIDWLHDTDAAYWR